MEGPAVPSPGARTAHRPLRLEHAELTGGPLRQWQDVNRRVSLPLAVGWLEKAGNLRNLRIAAGEADGEFRGPVYMDSDVHKVLESAAWHLREVPDEALADFAGRTALLLERAQQDDGYLDSHYQVAAPGRRYAQLVDSHELYCAGHLIQAAVAARRSSGDTKLLAVARRFADHLADVFLPGPGPGLDGHPEVETALVELYRVTGEERYLELSAAFVERRGHGLVGRHKHGTMHRQDHLPVRTAPTLTGHAVRGLYLEAGVVDVAVETGDEELLAASVARWEDMTAAKTSLTGGLGSRQVGEVFGERYELPPDLSYNETCASAASIQWSWRLLLATGEARYADLIERTLYNAFSAARSTDGRTYYKGNPLTRRPDHAEAVGDPRCRDEWFFSACCPPAVTRLVASLEHYAATVSEHAGVPTFHLHQYAPMELACPFAGGRLGLRVETDYPWHGRVAITITEAPAGPFALALRIPPWSARTTLETPDGARLDAAPDEHGYAVVSRDWRAGEQLVLHLDLTPRLTVPHPRIDALRGSAAVERGPLVYCFEQADQEEGAEVDDLALPLGVAFEEVEHADLAGVGRTVLLRAAGLALGGAHEAGLPYRTHGGPYAEDSRCRTSVTAVPYFQWDNRGDGAMRVWVPFVSG
ncbi:glycoside hydrolase family 127 protein [Streptomyces sp. NBC_01808]|uniref:glycoside hydrolase family 127 protein n=1 Tax=Streptomyces sp. NBC_01808 TaxID=2975947 RepID=UPI002DDA14DD|nr:beta-L-arabinofuranosidase domain-containing protein [Streptomyces sp. NBC_01808]WSA36001.1 glycoside hydrolase family 127 protein [Streptomyces sp. NBC_01808]